MPNITFRPEDDSVNERLATVASANNRPIAVEMRAAIGMYLDLQDLVRLREETALGHLTAAREVELARRIKDSIGRVLLAAISKEAQSLFEDAVNIEYPEDQGDLRLMHIPTPFEKVIDWAVTGSPASATG